MFVPLVHPPGEAQADFGEALVVIAGVEQKAHLLAMDCPHSEDGFVAAFPDVPFVSELLARFPARELPVDGNVVADHLAVPSFGFST